MSHSNKIRVYTNGIVDDGVGAYAYIVLENEAISEGIYGRTILRSKFAQGGKASEDVRMKMRAVYEGLRHCPDGMEVEVYTEHFLLKDILESTRPNETDGDIAERYRRYVAEHRIVPTFCLTKTYYGKDYPDNDHDEWTWYAHWLCENEIKKLKKTNKKYESTD